MENKWQIQLVQYGNTIALEIGNQGIYSCNQGTETSVYLV